ncbi:MAG TPA: CHAT domain-containing protein, partial [Blastocatellia bacterium]|nr:CHAT domain-containing protein [Blastocatellia bacterium]
LPEIQRQVLDPDTLLLEYSLGERRSFLFAVTPTEIQSFVLPGRNEIERQTKRMLALLEASGRPQAFKSMAARRRWERTIQLLAGPGRARKFKSPAAKQRWEERVRDDYQRSAALLSRSLLAPVGELLSHKRLLIVGDGVLHYLPFAALPEPAAEASSASSSTMRRQGRTAGLPPLVVNHEIAMIPSASTLAVLRQELNGRPVASKMVAVLADPVFDRDDERLTALPREKIPEAPEFQWSVSDRNSAPGGISGALFRQSETGPAPDLMIPRLPGSRREAEAIMTLVPETQKMAAFDFDANLATARSAELGAYRYLHFATHGLINSERPELSGLVLSLVDREGNRQPGILRTQDIYNLKLPVELVVLSACRTALGKESGGEGVMGLTRGFFYAGARRVIASLWMVNDSATAELMRRFYHELLSEKRLSPAAALRAAQVSMWRERKWEAPYYWAAFTLQGEW